MAKRVILFAVIILGCSIFTDLNGSKATEKEKTASASDGLKHSKRHGQPPQYRVLNMRYVSRASLYRGIGNANGVRIKLLQNGMDNTDIEDFSLAHDSGNEFRMGNVYGIDNSTLPLYVKVTYRSWNAFHSVRVDVVYEFMIFYPGTWDITICN